MKKPTKKYPYPKCFDYHEVIEYIEAKHGINTSNYKPEDGEYRNFWHRYCDELQNGSVLYLEELWIEEEDDEDNPSWVREILELIYGEFAPDEDGLSLFVEW